MYYPFHETVPIQKKNLQTIHVVHESEKKSFNTGDFYFLGKMQTKYIIGTQYGQQS